MKTLVAIPVYNEVKHIVMVLDEVRMAFRMHRDMAEELIKVLQVKNEMLADEVETFFDQYGLYTPKVELRREAPADVVEGEVV